MYAPILAPPREIGRGRAKALLICQANCCSSFYIALSECGFRAALIQCRAGQTQQRVLDWATACPGPQMQGIQPTTQLQHASRQALHAALCVMGEDMPTYLQRAPTLPQ